MKKFVLILAVFGLTGAGALLAPAQSADVYWCATYTAESLGQPDPGYGDICAGGSQDGTGYVYADGAEGNPDPFDGFISASNDGSQDEDGICGSTEGDPGEETDENGDAIEDDAETPDCNEAFAQAVVDMVTGG